MRLCRLVNAVSPGIVKKYKVTHGALELAPQPRINTPTPTHQDTDRPFECMANIGHFIAACKQLGVSPIFETCALCPASPARRLSPSSSVSARPCLAHGRPDLFEGKNMRPVAQCIHALARLARQLQYGGPLLAPQSERMVV